MQCSVLALYMWGVARVPLFRGRGRRNFRCPTSRAQPRPRFPMAMNNPISSRNH
ncbi:hypothetical protein BS47DRAFT_1345243 [Hydnum rufescens UP504]|uniref:Uncharacterized protein n=1 Tax=Hydnum rufescens UP504 TaxID=1448309 RepID=A0A9P6AVE7_9AGAM|nr:hypothetical protein BS47DRAFT_1345243 [Hydnum rufescens UP504]